MAKQLESAIDMISKRISGLKCSLCITVEITTAVANSQDSSMFSLGRRIMKVLIQLRNLLFIPIRISKVHKNGN